MTENDAPVRLTTNAAKQIAHIMAAEGGARTLRIAVSGGGCSGFPYGFALDDPRKPDDVVIESDGATVVIDSVSLPFLAGAEIDYVEELIGASFQIRNPNASASCSCGASFSVG